MAEPSGPEREGPFRRTGWKGTPPADSGPEAEESSALLRSSEQAPTGGGVRDLARAFQLNAEILRRIQETQKQIADSLERSDRSEMVVQSADALNETFRGVKSTQRALLERIEETRSRSGRTLLIAGAAAIIAIVGVVLGARWLVESTREETRREVSDAWREDRRARDQARESDAAARSLLEETRRSLEQSERATEDARRELAAVKSNSRELQGRLSALETLPRQLDELRTDVRVREERLVERDARIVSLEKDLLGSRRREGELEAKLEASVKSESQLRAELSRREGLGSRVEPSEAAPEPEIPPDAVTNPDQIQGLLSALNRLLAEATGEEKWRFDSVQGVSGRKLLGAQMRNYGFGLRMQKTIRAERCTITLRSEERRVELLFEAGDVEFSGARVRFLGNRYFVFISGVDPDAWRRAGLTVLDLR